MDGKGNPGLVSIIIPAKNEVYLEKTIRSVLETAEGDVEVIAILDAWIPEPQINIGDNRVFFIHYPEPIGQRRAINEGVRRCSGEYMMKLDAHCILDKGWDIKLKADYEPDWTVIPRMYNLNRQAWAPKFHKVTDYMYISSPDSEKPFRPQYFEGKAKDDHRRQPKNDKLIDETMCCMGCCWFMSVKRFWELGGCDENHEGGWGQQSIEVSLKAWLSGGKLMVNKKTWFAHWFRGSDGGFPYEIKESQIERVRQYSKDLWLNDKWEGATKKLQWLVEKFNPPGWDMHNEEILYNWVFKDKNRFPNWRGNRILKYPTDLILYEQVIWETKPDFIIECGTAYGGATLFLADMCEICGNGKVISIDRSPIGTPKHPRITYITGRTTAEDVLKEVKGLVSGKVMVILDSDHRRVHVKRELYYYSDIVTSGQYMVVEDAWYKGKPHGPAEAIQWFTNTRKGKQFKITGIDDQFKSCLTRGGWLKRI